MFKLLKQLKILTLELAEHRLVLDGLRRGNAELSASLSLLRGRTQNLARRLLWTGAKS
jgi:hypothetical protein